MAVNAKDLRDDRPEVHYAILARIEDEENVDKVRRPRRGPGDLAVHARRQVARGAGGGAGADVPRRSRKGMNDDPPILRATFRRRRWSTPMST